MTEFEKLLADVLEKHADRFDANERAAVHEEDRRDRLVQDDFLQRLCRLGVPQLHAEVICGKQVEPGGPFDQHWSDFLRNDRWVLVLAGGRGCGKTLAAACYFAQTLQAWTYTGSRNCTSPSFEHASCFNAVRHGDPHFEKLKGARVLVVDDLGTQGVDEKGFVASLIDSVMDCRYGARRKTLITTNLKRADFGRRYPRLDDRVYEGLYAETAAGSWRRRPRAPT